jgi:hypothetical protein
MINKKSYSLRWKTILQVLKNTKEDDIEEMLNHAYSQVMECDRNIRYYANEKGKYERDIQQLEDILKIKKGIFDDESD